MDETARWRRQVASQLTGDGKTMVYNEHSGPEGKCSSIELRIEMTWKQNDIRTLPVALCFLKQTIRFYF